jgi:hypothetical protein
MCDVMLLFAASIAGKEIRLGDGKYDCRHRDCEERVDPLVDCRMLFVTGQAMLSCTWY